MIIPTKQQWANFMPSAKVRVFGAYLCEHCQFHRTCYDGNVCPYDTMSSDESFAEVLKFKKILKDEEE